MKPYTLRRRLLVPVALLAALPVGWGSAAYAQAMPGAQASPAAKGMQQVEGKIKSVDPSPRMWTLLTLEDGTQLTIPVTVIAQRLQLKEGAIVKASFEDRSGEKVVTSLEVKPGT